MILLILLAYISASIGLILGELDASPEKVEEYHKLHGNMWRVYAAISAPFVVAKRIYNKFI